MSAHGHGGGGGIDWTNPLTLLVLIIEMAEHSEVIEGARYGFQNKEGGGHH